MKHQSDEKDDEQVMGEPEHLEIRSSDDLHGGSDDEDEGERDDHPRQSRYGCEHHYGWVLGNPKHKKLTYKTSLTKIAKIFQF